MYANDPIDSVGAMLDLSDQGEEVTITSFELPEQESFIEFATTLGEESENIVKKEEDKFQQSDWLDLRGKLGPCFMFTEAINTLVLMNITNLFGDFIYVGFCSTFYWSC